MFCERRNGYELLCTGHIRKILTQNTCDMDDCLKENLCFTYSSRFTIRIYEIWDMTYDIWFHCWFPISSTLIFHTRHGSECHLDSIMLLMDVSSKLNILFYLTSFGFDQTLGLTNCRHYERLLRIIDANNVCYPAFGNLCNEGPRSLNFFLSI